MKVVKKALCSTLMLACAAMITSANAQTQEDTTKPRAVLFKLHDIKPVLNADGIITHCDFVTTFYNRSTSSLKQAQVEFGWTDEVSAQYFNDDIKIENQAQPSANSRNKKEVEKLGDITTVVDMPSLGSYKQVSVKSSVKSEKCFLLLGNMKYRVNSCALISSETSDSASRRRANTTAAPSECAQLFEYVDLNNPEYHDEFKEISYSEQERITDDNKKQDVKELDTSYDVILKNFGKAQNIIDGIQ